MSLGMLAGLRMWARRATAAVEEQDAPTVARIVLSELPRVWSAAHADEREALLALRLGATLESGGNRDTMRELTRALARAQPDLVSPIKAHGGLTLRELVEREPRFAPPTALASRTFHGSPPVRSTYAGRHTLLGAMPPAPDAREDEPEVLLFARGEPTRRGDARSVSISAVSAANPQVPLWSQHVAMRSIPVNNWEQRVAFAPGIVLLALDEGVIALGRDGDGDGGIGTATRPTARTDYGCDDRNDRNPTTLEADTDLGDRQAAALPWRGLFCTPASPPCPCFPSPSFPAAGHTRARPGA